MQTGIRFQPARSTTNQKDAVPGRPCPDALLEDEAEALQDMQRCIEQFHDDSRSDLPCAVLCCAVLCPCCAVLTYVLHVTFPLQAQPVLITSKST